MHSSPEMGSPNTNSASQYSASVYSESISDGHRDRPGTPTSFECFIMLEGGRTSATDLLPSNLQQTKLDRLTEREEWKRAVFEASFLRAENVWLRENRKAGIILQEGTVQPAAELLREGAEDIHQALLQFHLVFGALSCFGDSEKESGNRGLTTNFQELISGFEKCREGLGKIRNASEILQDGSETFKSHIAQCNKSYAEFFGIDYKP